MTIVNNMQRLINNGNKQKADIAYNERKLPVFVLKLKKLEFKIEIIMSIPLRISIEDNITPSKILIFPPVLFKK